MMSHCRNLLFFLFASLLASASLAKTYQVPSPGNSGKGDFPGCSFNDSTNTYSCSGDLVLNNDDRIEIRGNPGTITFDVAGEIKLGARVRVNEGAALRTYVLLQQQSLRLVMTHA